MMIRTNKYVLTGALLASIGLSMSPAMAQPGKGKGGPNHDKGGHHEYIQERHDHDDDKITIRIGGDDRDIIRHYLHDEARANCPPGLAKKNPPCIPPGQAKKWHIGHRLPDDVRYFPIGDDLRGRLGPVPAGYQYVRVDKDILLIGEATKKVIDAVTLISAVD